MFSYPEYQKTVFSDLIRLKYTHDKIFDFFDKNHGLTTPLKNYHF